MTKAGHNTFVLWSNSSLLIELKAFDASTIKTDIVCHVMFQKPLNVFAKVFQTSHH